MLCYADGAQVDQYKGYLLPEYTKSPYNGLQICQFLLMSIKHSYSVYNKLINLF